MRDRKEPYSAQPNTDKNGAQKSDRSHAAAKVDPVRVGDKASSSHGSGNSASTVVNGANKASSSKKRTFIILGVIVALLAAVYGGGYLFFSGHFFPNTVLNDQDLSFQPSEALASQIQDQADAYSLTIEGEGFSYTFNQGETAINIDAQKIAEDTTKAQDVALWFIEVFRAHDISDVVVASYDEEGFSDTLRAQIEQFNEDQTASQNAKFTYDEDEKAFSLVSEVYGTQIDADSVIANAMEAVKAMRTECEVTQEDLIMPTVLAADPRSLQALQDLESLFPNEVVLTLNETVEAATINKATFASWAYIDPETFSVEIDKDVLTDWVDEATSGMNTVGTKRTWTREDGKKCTVSGGTYGWKVDTSSLADTVYDTLSKGSAASIDIPCSQTGGQYSGAGERDWGAYVDVDLTQQKARYYDENGELLYSCDIVSGLPTADRATPTGVYYLNSKQSPATLVGYTSSGEIDYETSVKYWMPFVGNSIGLHDATWQSSFGGSRYKTNGSHGCVNLSLSDAKWFYENLSTGVCIITHN